MATLKDALGIGTDVAYWSAVELEDGVELDTINDDPDETHISNWDLKILIRIYKP